MTDDERQGGVGGEGIWRRMVFGLFRRMKLGRLEVRDGGSREIFGGLGTSPSAAIEVREAEFYRRCIVGGPIGFAESYMLGEWDSPDPAAVVAFFILNGEESGTLESPGGSRPAFYDLSRIYNRILHARRPNSLRMSRRNIGEHYDLSNAFFALWLDPSMTYSCALFEPGDLSLEAAQTAKYEALCRRLRLCESDHVLEIGTGWGGFCIHAARTRGCRVTTTTISAEQYAEARRRVTAAGLAGRVEILQEDYRNLRGRYDKIASIEMLEAVGDAYVDGFFGKCSELLLPEGLLGLQAILCGDQQYEVLRRGVDFIQKHIFPGSLLMSVGRILRATGRTRGLNLLEHFDMGPHYARTLRSWRDRFDAREADVAAMGFEGIFIRKWRYYLAYCEAAFATREITVAQMIFTNRRNLRLNPGTPAADFPYALPAR